MKCEIKFFFILIICVVMCCLSCKIKIVSPEWYEQVQEYIKTEKYNEAINIFESYKLSKWQKVDWYYYDYAVALYKTNPSKVRYSISMLKNANAFSNNDKAIFYHLGMCFYEIGEYKKAIDYFLRSQNYSHKDYLFLPENIDTDFWLIVLNELIGNHNDVEKLIKQNNNRNSEIELLKQINKGKISLKEICEDSELSIGKKIHCINFYFYSQDKYNNINKYVTECKNVLLSCNNEIANYLNTNLIYFYLLLNDTNEIEKLLKIFGKYPFYLIDSQEFLVKEKFYEYLSFYYWKKGDGIMANNSLEIFKRYHFKPINFKSKADDRLENIPDFFGNTLDFQYLIKDKNY